MSGKLTEPQLLTLLAIQSGNFRLNGRFMWIAGERTISGNTIKSLRNRNLIDRTPGQGIGNGYFVTEAGLKAIAEATA